MENHTDESVLQRKLSLCLTQRAMRILIVMSTLMTMTMIVANLAATKIWAAGPIPVDGGLLLFPLSYILGDLLVEIYGRQTADSVAWASCFVGFLTVPVIYLVGVLPSYPGADNSGFVAISENFGRIFVASMVGFIASQILNNYVFERILHKWKHGPFWYRAFVSSALAHIPDILFFEPIAFLGQLSFKEFVTQAVSAYVAAVVVELILLLFVTNRLAKYLPQRLGFQHGKRI